jgi:hypothetical protein
VKTKIRPRERPSSNLGTPTRSPLGLAQIGDTELPVNSSNFQNHPRHPSFPPSSPPSSPPRAPRCAALRQANDVFIQPLRRHTVKQCHINFATLITIAAPASWRCVCAAGQVEREPAFRCCLTIKDHRKLLPDSARATWEVGPTEGQPARYCPDADAQDRRRL